jgi:hypothetical protein
MYWLSTALVRSPLVCSVALLDHSVLVMNDFVYDWCSVQEDADVRGDGLTAEGEAAYWSMRYTIRRGVTEETEYDVPVFLESSSEAILVTGEQRNQQTPHGSRH